MLLPRQRGSDSGRIFAVFAHDRFPSAAIRSTPRNRLLNPRLVWLRHAWQDPNLRMWISSTALGLRLEWNGESKHRTMWRIRTTVAVNIRRMCCTAWSHRRASCFAQLKVFFVQKTYTRLGNAGNLVFLALLKSATYVESIAGILRSRSGPPNNSPHIKYLRAALSLARHCSKVWKGAELSDPRSNMQISNVFAPLRS